jgi:hypothetical protein
MPAPNVCDPGEALVSVTVRSVLGMLPAADVSPDPDPPRVSVYPAEA